MWNDKKQTTKCLETGQIASKTYIFLWILVFFVFFENILKNGVKMSDDNSFDF
jgi:hypothetical protein